MRAAVLAVLLVLPQAVSGGETSLPPGERPVRVQAGFFLVNLSGVFERSETFNADVYVNFRWRDSRLAFDGTEPRRFLEHAAAFHLEQIWWPHIEFVNTAEPDITNQALEIAPDGTVRYLVGLTSDFRANLDLRQFPFDRQRLEVRIQSFFWRADEMVFVADPGRIGFNPESTFEGLVVKRVATEIHRSALTGWGDAFSEFVALIDVERQAAFHLWTVFVPVILIFLISCSAFVVSITSFQHRVGIGLTALLACIATQFAMSVSLPQISYLTSIDRLFLVTYACIALAVLISTVEASLLIADRALVARVDRIAGLGLPVVFFTLLALAIFW